MCRTLALVILPVLLIGCPEPVQTPQAPSGPSDAPPSAPDGVAGAPPPPQPGPPGIPADQLQRELGALSKKGNAVKEAFEQYVVTNSVGGYVTIDNGEGQTIRGQWIRSHDPVRYQEGKGFVALADFQTPDMPDGVYHRVAFWARESGTGYEVFEVAVQGHPEKKGGTWVHIDQFPVDDTVAKPIK